MIKINLHGSLKKYGESFNFDVKTPAMAIRALVSQIKGIGEDIRTNKFILKVGKGQESRSISAGVMQLSFGRKDKEFHIIPALEGSGGRVGAIIKIVVGVALLAVGVGGAILAGGAAGAGLGGAAFSIFGATVTWGGIAATGLAITLAGVSAALTSRPDLDSSAYTSRERPDDRPSFLFTAPKNRSEQGMPIPIVYGKMRVGSVTVSTGLATEAI